MRNFRLLKYYFLPLLLFIILFAVTLYVYFEFRHRAEAKTQVNFNRISDEAVSKLKNRLNDYIQILKGGKGFVSVSDTVTREEWKKYIEELQIQENFPGIQGVGYTIVFSSSQRKVVEEKIRREGFENFSVSPGGNRDIYSSIIYLEPFSGRNLRAFGFDMFSEPVRREAMIMARDSNAPAMSGRVILVQETQKDRQPGFLIYLPVYRGYPETVAERQSSLKGYVYSPFRATDLMRSVWQEHFRDIDIEVYDGDPSPETLLFNKFDNLDYFRKDQSRAYFKTVRFSMGGRQWTLYLSSLPGFGTSADRTQPVLVLVGGSIISLLVLFSMIFLVQVRSADELKETITDNASAALFMIDNNGNCTFMNPAAENMVGYSFRELKNRSMHEIVHYKHLDGTPYPAADCPIHRSARNSQELKRHEDVFFRKDGTPVYVMCTIRSVVQRDYEKGTLIEAVDITEDKKNKQAIMAQNEELKRINSELDNFIYTASHDLKAPISNIEALLTVIGDELGDKASEDILHVIGLMNTSVNRFKETIQDLTDISRIRKNVKQDVEQLDIEKIIEDVKAGIIDWIYTSKTSIRCDLSEVKTIRFSRTNFKSIIYNLISNAIKYRSPDRKPEVTIQTKRFNEYVLIIVRDNGLGISEKNIDKIFTMFKRFHNHVEGSGVGLYLVKRIVENAEGYIEVESELDKGTEFRIFLRQD